MFPAISVPPALQPVWTKVSGSDALAVDLGTVKSFVNRALEDDTWDAEIGRFIRAAQRAIERDAEVFLTPSVWRGTLPQFLDQIRIVRRPFVDITKIEYVAVDGTITTLPTSMYQALPIQQACGMIFRGADNRWPDTAKRWDAVRIEVRCGYGLADVDYELGHPPMPEDVLHALLMTFASMDNARGDVASSSDTTVYAMKASKGAGAVPQEARALLSDVKYRWVSI